MSSTWLGFPRVPDAEPTELSARALARGRADALAALAALREPPDDDDDEAKLLRAGISAMRNFYSSFFSEVYDTEVEGFGWEDKRKAVRAILDGPPGADVTDEGSVADARYELATLFEDLSDALHGDIDFGYTDDIEVLREFGNNYLETWIDLVLDWLATADPATGSQLRDQFDQGAPS
jgi:hypothetical protein